MPTRSGYAEGIPSWADLATSDLEDAKEFYSALFGWSFHEEATDSGPYAMASQKGLSAAGIGEAPEGSPIGWSTYIAVEDVDATAARIREAGGSLMFEPMDVMDAGRMAFAIDPTGAVFGIWQAGNHFGAAIVNEHGALNWNELTTNDVPTALEFYKTVFGYGSETSKTLTGRDYTVLTVGDRAIAGIMEPPMEGIPNHWGVYFAVDDAEQAANVALEKGGEKVYGPMEAPEVGIFVGLRDPQGAELTLIQLASPID